VIKLNKSKKLKLYVIMAIIVCSLLFYAIGIELNLIASPILASDIVAIGALTVAVVLVIMMYSISFFEKRKGALSEVPIKQVIDAVKESNQAADATLPPANIQKNTIEVEPNSAEQKNQLAKQLMTPPGKLICPACRKEFSQPILMTECIVDYGPPSKLPKKIVYCPYCTQPINLKQKSTAKKDIWE
jgi:hypothetical protein